jgi:hypothetical protein
MTVRLHASDKMLTANDLRLDHQSVHNETLPKESAAADLEYAWRVTRLMSTGAGEA